MHCLLIVGTEPSFVCIVFLVLAVSHSGLLPDRSCSPAPNAGGTLYMADIGRLDRFFFLFFTDNSTHTMNVDESTIKSL